MSNHLTDLRIGPLLKKMGLINGDQLEDLLQQNRTTDLPVGSVLVMTGQLSDRILRTAVQAQSMLKDNLASPDQVVDAIGIVSKSGVSLTAALKQVRWSRDSELKSSTLGELLQAARLVNPLKLTKALTTSQSSMLPLGRVLVLTNALSRPLLMSTLDTQTKIRLGYVNREQAIAQLCSLRDRQKSVEQALQHRVRAPMPKGVVVQLGELLVESQIISTSDLLTALELSIQTDQRVGEVLLDFEWITEAMLKSVLEMQNLVACRVVSRDAAIRALNHMKNTGATLTDAVDRETSPQTKRQSDITQDEFLRLAGVLAGVPIAQLVAHGELSTGSSANGNLTLHSSDDKVFDKVERKNVLDAAETLRECIRLGSLNLDQAMICMSYCLRGGMDVTEAVKQLGWTISVPV
jgi:hypothetical protein